ncbi:MAG: M20/M25/M40 family metallo-hydrolase [Bacillota bacterium]|nr:M20/M25/M40 family metallo-hydrolase [Bacillota bacterium]
MMKVLKQNRVLMLVIALTLLVSATVYAEPVHKDIFSDYSADDAIGHIEVLAATDDAREAGTEGEHRAADYIADYFEELGLQVERQTFPMILFKDLGSELTMLEPSVAEFETKTFMYSPSTPEGGLTAELAYAGLGYPEDFAGKDFTGKIALIRRGAFTFYQKVQNAAAAGAIGAIIFNNTDGIINGTLSTPTDIPALAILQEDGENLVGLIEEGNTVKVNMNIQTIIEESYSQNVIATKLADRGKGRNTQTIVLGAHYDSVDTPGANDNASGTATIMEVARLMADKKLAYDVKFIAFGAEETGLVGSEEYVLELEENGEIEDIVAMINLDMVGVGDTLVFYMAYEETPTWLQEQFIASAQILGLQYDTDYSDRSDHANFEWFGIPTTFLSYRPDPYYHTDEDSIDKIQEEDMYNTGTLVASVLYQIAKTPMPKSPKGLKAKAAKLHSVVKGEKVYMK